MYQKILLVLVFLSPEIFLWDTSKKPPGIHPEILLHIPEPILSGIRQDIPRPFSSVVFFPFFFKEILREFFQKF